MVNNVFLNLNEGVFFIIIITVSKNSHGHSLIYHKTNMVFPVFRGYRVVHQLVRVSYRLASITAFASLLLPV